MLRTIVLSLWLCVVSQIGLAQGPAPFDETEARVRMRQAANAASVAASEVERLRSALEQERKKVVQTSQERQINEETTKRLQLELRAAEDRLRAAEAEANAAKVALNRGLPLPPGPPGQERRILDCAKCPELVPIPAGSFQMGPASGEEEREGVPESLRIGSSHPVTVPSFALGKYEVTIAEFSEFVTDTHHPTGYCEEGSRGDDWKRPFSSQNDREPAVCVNWIDAMAYVAWLSKTTGKSYRLPSEAEWEYAARAGKQTVRHWGDSRDEACRYGNVADLTYGAAENASATRIFLCTDGFVYTSPVGKFDANAFGLYDMLGNVQEWTADCFNMKYEKPPMDGRPWLTGNCDSRVVRGGSWKDAPDAVRSASRWEKKAGSRNRYLGFRVARTN